MGEKGSRLTAKSTDAAETFVKRLLGFGFDDISSRNMFGGNGLFAGKKMFGLVDSTGKLFLKAGPDNEGTFLKAGARKHGRMPYYEVPGKVLSSTAILKKWVGTSIEL